MKILFITPQLPYPPRQGTTIRNYNLIRYLADSHTVDLLTLAAPGEKLDATSPLHECCRRIGTVPQPVRSTAQRIKDTFSSPLPDMGHRLESAEMRALIDQWLDEAGLDETALAETGLDETALNETGTCEWDIVQIEGIEVAQYGAQILDGLRQRFPNQADALPKLVFDDHNCEYLLQKRNALNDLLVPKRWIGGIYSTLQWQKLRRYERQICQDADATLAVSIADKDALQKIAPDADITVVFNGFDPPEEPPEEQPENLSEEQPDASERRTSKTLLYIGKMDYRPNVDAMLWFGREILPIIQSEIPDTELKIVGMNPHPRLDELSTVPGIEITGMVEELGPYLAEAAVYVIPLRVGGGTRFKALEAMAYRKPIVATSLGIEGIPVEDRRDLLIADSAADFAAAVVRLLRDQEAAGTLSQTLGENGCRLVESTFTWASIMPVVEGVYDRITTN